MNPKDFLNIGMVITVLAIITVLGGYFAIIQQESVYTSLQKNASSNNVASSPASAFPQSQNICDNIVDSTFKSVSLHEVGLGLPPFTQTAGYWGIRFMSDGSFFWSHSDLAEQGYYTCTDGMLSAGVYNRDTGKYDLPVVLSFDSLRQVLTWDGIQYSMQKP